MLTLSQQKLTEKASVRKTVVNGNFSNVMSKHLAQGCFNSETGNVIVWWSLFLYNYLDANWGWDLWCRMCITYVRMSHIKGHKPICPGIIQRSGNLFLVWHWWMASYDQFSDFFRDGKHLLSPYRRAGYFMRSFIHCIYFITSIKELLMIVTYESAGDRK